MVEKFADFICKYIQGKAEVFKGYLLAALENKEGYVCFISESLGTDMSIEDVRNGELLADAGLFKEETKFTRSGKNRYQIFHLTDLGREMAEQIKNEGYDGKIPESAPIIG